MLVLFTALYFRGSAGFSGLPESARVVRTRQALKRLDGGPASLAVRESPPVGGLSEMDPGGVSGVF